MKNSVEDRNVFYAVSFFDGDFERTIWYNKSTKIGI